MLKILHFADAHIDMANYGQHDPTTGLPARVIDFLTSLDAITNAAINEKVDLVVFSGDAYRDRSPAPTFQREWDRRIIRLSQAGIQTVLLTGNHDIAPSALRAHAMQEIETLETLGVSVVTSFRLFKPDDLGGLPMYLIAIPWITRAAIAESQANTNLEGDDTSEPVIMAMHELLDEFLSEMDPSLPVLLAAHASVEGAEIGQERMITVGKDLMLPPGLLKNPKFDYVALGHIHKHQNLNKDAYPPVVYSGSIERVDFGEIHEEKGYVMVELERGKTRYAFRPLKTRPFIDLSTQLHMDDPVMDKLVRLLPSEKDAEGAIVRLSVYYPEALETQIDEAELRRRMKGAFQFTLSKSPERTIRTRLSEGQETSLMTPVELLERYWRSTNTSDEEREKLLDLASQIIDGVKGLSD